MDTTRLKDSPTINVARIDKEKLVIDIASNKVSLYQISLLKDTCDNEL